MDTSASIASNSSICAFLSRATVISSMDKLRETERAKLAEKLDHQIHNTADKAHYIKKRGEKTIKTVFL